MMESPKLGLQSAKPDNFDQPSRVSGARSPFRDSDDQYFRSFSPFARPSWSLRTLLCYALALLFFTACATKSAVPQPNTSYDEWKVRAKSSRPYLDSKHEQRVTYEGARQPEKPEPKPQLAKPIDLPTQKISVRFIGNDVADVLRALGRMANQNILINPGVSGKVNANIANTPWNVVFTGLINSYGLILRQEGSLLRVMTVDDFKRQVERQSLQLEQTQVAPLVTKVINIEFSNPEEIAASVRPMLSKDKKGNPRGTVTVDRHSRSLIVNDIEDNMQRLQDLIATLDRPTPQILIEAHIIETTQDMARELGVQWGAGWKKYLGNDRYFGLGNSSAGAIQANPTSIPATQNIVDLPAQALGEFNAASLGLAYFNSSGDILQLQLSALQKEGKVNIISEPSIVTLDNNQAIIESGREIPYQTIEDGSVKIAYKEATLKLTVTPHVISDRMIKLGINAKKDEVDFANSVAGNPMIIKKQADTQLIVENGSTVVIAGLSKETRQNNNVGVPKIKNLPGLGWLFKNDSRSSDFEEILIFISPKILVRGKTPGELKEQKENAPDKKG